MRNLLNTINKKTIMCVEIIVAIIITIAWILVYHDPYYITEMCIARIIIVSFLIISFHYLYFVKKTPVRKIIKPLLLFFIGIITYNLVAYCFITYHLSSIEEYSTFLRFTIFSLCLSTLIILLYCFIKQQIDVNKYIALTILLMGSIFSVSYPTAINVSWDDITHYERALHISHAFSDSITQADYEILNFENKSAVREVATRPKELYLAFEEKVNNLYMTEHDYISRSVDILPNAVPSYLPSAIALFFSRGLSLPYSITFFLGKWINVLFYSLIIYLALKKLKSGKLIIFMISMFPTTLTLASNYSYDTWGIGLSILAFSWYIGILQDKTKKITIKDLISICLIYILAFSAKPIYFCLVLVMLFVKKEKLDSKLSRKTYITIILATCLIIAMTFILPFFISGVGGNDMRGGATVNSFEQVSYIFSHPLKYTKVLLKFLSTYWSLYWTFDYTANMLFLGIVPFATVYFIFFVIITILDKSKEDVSITNAINRIWTIFMAFMGSVFVATCMYIAYTPVASNTITGCQGRYLTPLLFFIGYYISDYRMIAPLRKKINTSFLITVTSIILILYALLGITPIYLIYIS